MYSHHPNKTPSPLPQEKKDLLHVPLKSLILAIEGNEKSKILSLAPRKGLFLHLKAIIVGEGEQSTPRE